MVLFLVETFVGKTPLIKCSVDKEFQERRYPTKDVHVLKKLHPTIAILKHSTIIVPPTDADCTNTCPVPILGETFVAKTALSEESRGTRN